MTDNEMRTSCQIRCLHCKEWFPSGIQFGTAEDFFRSTLIGNLQQCSNGRCRKMTGCNRENMRFEERRPDGKVTYVEGSDTF